MAKKHLDSIAVRTLFLSDLHLGTKGCQAGLLLDFLKHCDVDTIYLVGDVVDGWRLKSGWYWPQSHNNVVRKLLKRVHKGVKIIYIPGNHDEFMRDYVGHNFGGIDVMNTAIHEAADGKRYLVMHGDQFDLVVRHAPWLAMLGDGAYELALGINTYLNMVRRRLGLDYWSLSSWAKLKVKSAVNHIGRFEIRPFGRGAPSRRLRRYLRPYPPCRDPRRIRRALHEHRRLGRELHRPCRALRRPLRDHSLGRQGARGEGSVGGGHAAAARGRGNCGVTKLLIATDAWGPQINGVVRSLENIAAHAAGFGVDVRFLTPTDFWTLPLPGYREIRLALANPRRVAGFIADFNPDFIHIATEGPIGLATRRACLAGKRTFTTSYHTRFPEYVAARLPVPMRMSYAALRRFHSAAAGTMVSSPSLENVLAGHGFRNLMRWSRGVDGTLFRPRPENALAGCRAPFSSSSGGSRSRRTSRPS